MGKIRLSVGNKSVMLLNDENRIVVYLKNGERRYFKTFIGLIEFVKNLDENLCF